MTVLAEIFKKAKKNTPSFSLKSFRIMANVVHFNKDVAPGKSSKINKHSAMFIPATSVPNSH